MPPSMTSTYEYVSVNCRQALARRLLVINDEKLIYRVISLNRYVGALRISYK